MWSWSECFTNVIFRNNLDLKSSNDFVVEIYDKDECIIITGNFSILTVRLLAILSVVSENFLLPFMQYFGHWVGFFRKKSFKC